MKFKSLFTCGIFLAATAALAQNSVQSELRLKLLPNEVWWGGATVLGNKMPFGTAPLAVNLDGDHLGNQAAPLLLSSQGRYIWAEKAFAFSVEGEGLKVASPGNVLRYGQAGQTLRSAYTFASAHFFPTDGKLPDLSLVSAPQYNTWIELMYDQNQRDILKYAHAIVDNGLPAGVLMIDDNWQENYGKWTFHPGRFPDPKAMMKELHALGFKVMLWVCPFISADSDVYRALARQNALLMQEPQDPAMITWWNGKSALLDLTNPVARTWFTGELSRLQAEYGVDGFKLDAGDPEFYNPALLAHQQLDANEHTRLFAEIGLAFPLNEYRASWKIAGRPLVQRLRDKSHDWADLHRLIPDMVAAGLLGYTFVCPDMIGGGEFRSFLHAATIDQDLIVRSAQVHALAPMMQFSVAPWRVLDATRLAAIKQAVALRQRFVPRILELVKASAATGEPILRPMAYVFPQGGYEQVKDQFMMGDNLLVAPMLEKGTARTVLIPAGQWKADDGKILNGPQKLTIEVPLARLPYFERQ
ncbi:MAG: glycoside hydrolase family 31 protein [Lacunisphaera sp.]|nr:glycoside hydrolase family 31 protein [Lacunisphaera sp.]